MVILKIWKWIQVSYSNLVVKHKGKYFWSSCMFWLHRWGKRSVKSSLLSIGEWWSIVVLALHRAASSHQLCNAEGTLFCLSSAESKMQKEKKATQFSKIAGSAREFVGVREMQRTNKSAVQIWGKGEFYRTAEVKRWHRQGY